VTVATDHFAVFGLERRAAIDVGLVKERFRKLGAGLHPDGAGARDTQGFEEANRARDILVDPVARLRHLLELEFGAGSAGGGGAVDSALMSLFADVGGAVEAARAVAQRTRAARSELARALLAGEVAAVQKRLAAAGSQVSDAIGSREAQLPEVDRLLSADRDRARAEGCRLYRDLAFLHRWRGQVQEAFASLF
jgi:hypothetical protein